jgi:hypothetical protein
MLGIFKGLRVYIKTACPVAMSGDSMFSSPVASLDSTKEGQ